MDRVDASRRLRRLAALPRRAGHRPRAGDARATTAPGSAGPAAPTGPRAVRGGRPVPGAGAADAQRRSRSSTRASPTPPSGRSTTTSSPSRSSTASGGTPTSRVNRAVRRRRRPRSPPRAPRSGSTTTSCSWCRRCCASCGPDLRIGFYLHIPFPPAELFQQLPWRRQILEGLLGADLVGFQLPGRRRRTSCGWCGSGSATRPTATWSTCPDGRTVRAAAVPDLDRLRGLRGAGAAREPVAERAAADPRGARQPAQDLPGRRPARLHQGHLRPAARVRRADRRRPPRRRGRGVRAGGHPVAGAGRAVPHAARRDRPAGRPHQRRPRPDRPAGDLLPALLLPARGDGRALPRRRRHGGHARTATA